MKQTSSMIISAERAYYSLNNNNADLNQKIHLWLDQYDKAIILCPHDMYYESIHS